MGELVVVATGMALIAAGVLWRGWIRLPFSPRRAHRYLADRYRRDLLRAADMAIVSARRSAAADEPAIVLVADVVRIMNHHFGHGHVPRHQAALALRTCYDHAGCRADCVTDAYE
ncbi:hypothetical protein ACFQVC_06290 [Streptomyces monticola]|uniref:Uncharacterized protein n=1 Tax=Streptomyces monticola TaxID=2666263 RepID=A0ABW2JCV1_9ACTN